MGNLFCCCLCVDQASIGVLEKWGRFFKLAAPGLHFYNPFAGECLAGVLSTRISSLDVRIETKTKKGKLDLRLDASRGNFGRKLESVVGLGRSTKASRSAYLKIDAGIKEYISTLAPLVQPCPLIGHIWNRFPTGWNDRGIFFTTLSIPGLLRSKTEEIPLFLPAIPDHSIFPYHSVPNTFLCRIVNQALSAAKVHDDPPDDTSDMAYDRSFGEANAIHSVLLNWHDNVFVQLLCSIQYRVVKENADDAFYELQNPKEQIQAYVFDVVRAHVPRITLDELFEQKGDVAQAVLEELEKVMGAYGYSIEHILMVDIIPDAEVRKAMNEINAAQRLQLACVYKGEAEKVLQVKRAEAEAEAKYLGGVGVARQRQAITEGLRDNILNFSHKVEGASAKDVMDLIMITQYFDTIKDLGNSSKNTTVFIPHGPGHVRDISNQIRNGMMEAASAQVNVE
ncbi:hypothetical protein HHK36_001017 [Tetracentron sinense]|uniref:Band 7 domain-containing protein n=1 Tax=Tetracentron sinense TaxID=13715 RepID=A0A835DRP1_TETSI|nr:hypothetical protein HHK36_001017 [Tetracentron sinense]